MEEILASIRRIISEDGTPAKDDGESAQEPVAPAAAAAAVPAEAAPQPAAPASPSAADPARETAPVTDDDALLLTEMVTDDGTVVSLAGGAPSQPAMGAPIEIMGEPPLPDPPAPDSVGADELDFAPLESEPEPQISAGAPEPAAASAPEFDAEPEPEPVSGTGLPELEPELPAEPEVEPDPEVDLADEQEEPVMADAAKRPDKNEDLGQRLVSDTTFTSSAAALSQLSRTVRRDKDFPLGGGRMVEDLVREALEPMLREWLDANLAGIVERLVRQEIERMVRRAEED